MFRSTAERRPDVRVKLHGGPHAGAEVELRPGDYVLGRAPDCDVVLHDTAVAAHHLAVTVGAGKVRIKPLATPVYLDGDAVGEAERAVAPGQRVTLGATQMSFGGEPARLSKRWLYCGFGLALLLAGGLFALGQANTGVVPPTPERRAPLAEARRIVQELGLTQLEIVELPDQAVRIQGYAATIQAKRELQRALATLDSPLVQQRVWVNAELAAAAGAVLDSLALGGLEVSTGRPGELIMHGYVGDEAAWRRALETLGRDIPGIRTLESNGVETLNQRTQALRNLLKQRALDAKLGVTTDADHLVVSGALSSQDMPAWTALLREFRQRYGEHPRLEARVQETRDTIDLAIKSVSVGPASYLVTKDGNKYMEGALINGYQIKTIGADRIVFTRDHRDYAYTLGN